ncbi:MAG TPA: 2-phospho-L-lactate guanylyltransferase [Thermomicrobiaceae bacterium]|nr:2-phospho-L-lactate guanylyltransferase [Thermomicrobiaceae bacterium]
MTAELTLAVVPVQRLGQAKSRLAGELTPDERRRLVLEVLTHVLSELREASFVSATLVVTPDETVATEALTGGAEVLRQPADVPGLNQAIRLAQAEATRRGASALLVVHGDLPLLKAGEIDEMVELAPAPIGIVTAPDRHRRGTNALLLRPPGIIEPHFGVDSLRLHQEAAHLRGIAQREYQVPGFAFDLDTAADLAALAESRR